MVLHDLHVVQFDAQDPASAHLRKSKLEWAHTQVVIQMCLTIIEDLKACLDAPQSDHSIAPDPKGKKPRSKRQKTVAERYDYQVHQGETIY